MNKIGSWLCSGFSGFFVYGGLTHVQPKSGAALLGAAVFLGLSALILAIFARPNNQGH